MTDTAKIRIIEAAGPIFAQKGFAATTVREICSEAKVNQAAINYYFGSKESLYKEVFTSTYSSFTPWNQIRSEVELDRSIPFEERFRGMVVRRTREMLATELSRWKIQLMFREIHDPTPCCGDMLQQYIVEDYQALYAYLDEYFDPAVPEDVRWKLVFNLLGMILHYKTSGWLVKRLIPEEMLGQCFQPEQIASQVIDAFYVAVAPYRRKSS